MISSFGNGELEFPSYASLDEAGMLVIEQSNAEFYNMKASMGLEELGILESTGSVMVYEDNKVKSFFEKIIAWIKARFEDIKKFFEAALKKFKAMVEKFKKKLVKSKIDALKNKVKYLKPKSYGKTYDYSGYMDILKKAGPVWNAVNKYDEDLIKVVGTLYNGIGYVTAEDDKANKSIGNSITNVITAKRKALWSGINSGVKDKKNTIKPGDVDKSGIASAESVKAAVLDIVRGKEIDMDKAYIIANINDMVKSSYDWGATASHVKQLFGKVKDEFDKKQKDVEKDSKKADKINEHAYMAYVSGLKSSCNVISTISTAAVIAMKEKLSRDQRVVGKLSMAFRDIDNMKGAVHSESSTFQSEVRSMFDY